MTFFSLFFTFFFLFLFQVEQIQAEYKVLALQFHPDKNDGDKEAEAKFQALKVIWWDIFHFITAAGAWDPKVLLFCRFGCRPQAFVVL